MWWQKLTCSLARWANKNDLFWNVYKNCGVFLIKGKFEDTKFEGVTISLNSKKDGIKWPEEKKQQNKCGQTWF
jgi:hypothetical protein